jgi:hypothetical protein
VTSRDFSSARKPAYASFQVHEVALGSSYEFHVSRCFALFLLLPKTANSLLGWSRVKSLKFGFRSRVPWKDGNLDNGAAYRVRVLFVRDPFTFKTPVNTCLRSQNRLSLSSSSESENHDDHQSMDSQ